MKKIYILAMAAFAFTMSANAQVLDDSDNFDSYTTGPISPQSFIWRTWSGDPTSAENALVTTAQANTAPNSMEVNNVGAPAGIDQLLLVEAQPSSGTYSVVFNFYVPSGQEGYFNLQGEITEPQAGSFLSSDIYFNQANGSPGIGSDGAFTWAFPHDTWFPVQIVVDLDAQTFTMNVNNLPAIIAEPFNDATVPYFGGMDFYATGASTLFYVDDVELYTGNVLLGVNSFEVDAVSVYPNPVKDVLNISSRATVDTVTVYDILGKVVLQSAPDRISPSIDMSSLASGAYLVNVTIGDASKTVKVIK